MPRYGDLAPRSQRFILCCGVCRSIDHSDEPNLRTDLAADRYGVDLAARDIAAGEELTLDYLVVEGARPGA